MARRWPGGVPAKVQAQVEHELKLIAELRNEPYFLTVEDTVRYTRTQGILCQGRGSAANSAVCYCLGITEVDPARIEALFERFISKERHESPDIDVDFERGPLSRLVSIENAAMEGRTVIDWDKTDLDALGLLKIDCLGLGMLSTMFSAGEAERLRRSMAIWRRHGGIEDFEARLIGGMRQRGYPESYARRIFEQIRGLGEYGFRRPMPRASRSWPIARPGSSATSPRPSPAPFPLGETPTLPDLVPMLRNPPRARTSWRTTGAWTWPFAAILRRPCAPRSRASLSSRPAR
jgi:DNA polymerase III alpha subunit